MIAHRGPSSFVEASMVRAAYAYREQRKHPRKRLHPPVTFALDGGERIAAYCSDISLGGAFLETPQLGIFASEVTVYLDFGHGEVGLRSTVRWTGGGGIGVQFGLLGARETNELVTYLDSEEAPE